MKIENTFFSQEQKNNFMISEPMKRAWAANLEILEDIQTTCQKDSLRVFACYGTLLGAVRDHGFIAWDDDIDLCFLRDDYIRFLDIFSDKFGTKYNILNPYTRSWFHMNFSHITNGERVRFDRKYLEKWFGCPFIMGPDIFPFYYVPRNKEDEKYILNMLNKIDYTIALVYKSNEQSEKRGKLTEKDNIIKALSLNLLELQQETGFVFSADRPLDNQLEILYDQVCRLTEENEADYVTRYNVYTKNSTYKFPKELFDKTIPIEFEMTTVLAPEGYDEVLRISFGNDYMIPQRVGGDHDYPFFKKQLKEIVDCGIEIKNFNEKNPNELKKEELLFELISDNKYNILYHTNVRSMLIYSEFVLEKIKKVLEFGQNSKGKNNLIWIADLFPQNDEFAMDLVVPELIYGYEKLISEYKNKGGIVITRDGLSDGVVDKLDEYYGDDGDIADLFKIKGKKITIQQYQIESIEIDN